MVKRRSRRSVAEVPTRVQLEGPVAGTRAEAEGFVREAFAAAYGARITQFMPILMTLRNDVGQLLAVLGLRRPGGRPLFLEQYLERPVEQVLSAAAATPVDRASLVEVGNFSVGAAGGGRWLITALTAFLFSAGNTWAVFTCGPELRNAFARLGVDLLDLGLADIGRLPAGQRTDWGSYYHQAPRVMAANVAQSHGVLSAHFGTECALSALWQRALLAGGAAA